MTWAQWLVDDQREASGRPDVWRIRFRGIDRADEDQRAARCQSCCLYQRHGFRLGGEGDRRLSRRGGGPAGHGRLRTHGFGRHFPRPLSRGFGISQAIASDKPLLYRFALPTANHVFLPGHRIMVQIQSSWFPLYDRNPQTFVPNIFWAKPGDYRKSTQRIFHTPSQMSFIELPLVIKP